MRDGHVELYFQVPKNLKISWIKQSRDANMRLGEWLISRIERDGEKKMNVYKIPEILEGAYHGAGYALAAILNDQPVALRYLSDVAPDLYDSLPEDGPAARVAIMRWIETPEAGRVVRELQALGQVSVGMCSCWEFCEL